jgi:hypothetical protein
MRRLEKGLMKEMVRALQFGMVRITNPRYQKYMTAC